MKFEHNPKYTTIAIYALLVLIIAMVCQQALQSIGVLFSFLSRLVGFVLPIVYGVVFAFLLNPLLRLMDDRFLVFVSKDRLKPSARRAMGLILTYLVAFIFVAIFAAIVIPQIRDSLQNINVPLIIQTLTNSITQIYNDLTGWLNELLADSIGAGDTAFADNINKLVMNFVNGTVEALQELESIGAVVNFTTSFTTGIINLVLGIIVSIYILMDREKLFAQSKKIGRALFSQDTYGLLYDITMDINRIFSGFVVGKVIDSIIMGILCLIGMSILQFEYAVLISVIVGVTNFIPYFGPFIGAIPGFIILFIVSPAQGFWFLVFILLLQQLDGNVIGPKILGDTIGLSPLWIIFSIMLFSGLMGILGMFIGVPLFAIIYSLVKRFISHLLRRKGESTNTRDYASDKNPLIK